MNECTCTRQGEGDRCTWCYQQMAKILDRMHGRRVFTWRP